MHSFVNHVGPPLKDSLIPVRLEQRPRYMSSCGATGQQAYFRLLVLTIVLHNFVPIYPISHLLASYRACYFEDSNSEPERFRWPRYILDIGQRRVAS